MFIYTFCKVICTHVQYAPIVLKSITWRHIGGISPMWLVYRTPYIQATCVLFYFIVFKELPRPLTNVWRCLKSCKGYLSEISRIEEGNVKLFMDSDFNSLQIWYARISGVRTCFSRTISSVGKYMLFISKSLYFESDMLKHYRLYVKIEKFKKGEKKGDCGFSEYLKNTRSGWGGGAKSQLLCIFTLKICSNQ